MMSRCLTKSPLSHAVWGREAQCCHQRFTAARPRLQRKTFSTFAQIDEEKGVQQLLARDRKPAPELPEGPIPASASAQTAAAPAPPAANSNKITFKSKRQRRKELAEAEGTAGSAQEEESEAGGPKRCGEALKLGLALFEEKKFSEAVEMFSQALELPGNGAYRLPGSPIEYSCPSDAEENAALYNMACAYSQLQQPAAAITCIEAVLENGFDDFDTIRTDPDLALCRGPQLDAVLSKYDNPLAKLQKALKGPDPNKSDTNKPWILW